MTPETINQMSVDPLISLPAVASESSRPEPEKLGDQCRQLHHGKGYDPRPQKPSFRSSRGRLRYPNLLRRPRWRRGRKYTNIRLAMEAKNSSLKSEEQVFWTNHAAWGLRCDLSLLRAIRGGP